MNHYKSKAHSIYCSTTITAPLIYKRIVVVIEYFCNKFSPLCTLQTVPARRRMRSFGTTMVNSGCGSIEQPLSITTNRCCGAARGTHTHTCVLLSPGASPPTRCEDHREVHTRPTAVCSSQHGRQLQEQQANRSFTSASEVLRKDTAINAGDGNTPSNFTQKPSGARVTIKQRPLSTWKSS